MSKQQEFLDYLKNPTRTRLRQAVEEFYQAFSNSIQVAYSYEHCESGEYIVEIQSMQRNIVIETQSDLISTIQKYLTDPFIDIRSHEWDDFNGLHKWTWLVKER